MSDNKILKKYRVCLGNPFDVQSPIAYSPPVRIHSVDNSNDNIREDMNKEKEVDLQLMIKNAKKEADEIIAQAHLCAASLTEECKTAIDQDRKTAYENGKMEGIQEGYKEAWDKCLELLDEAEKVRKEAENEYTEVISSMENDIVNLVLEVANKVLVESIEDNKGHILALAKEAIKACSDKNHIKLKISESDYDYVSKNKSELNKISGGTSSIDLIKDISLSNGDCIAETEYGCVDTSVKTRMRIIENAFKELVGQK